MFHFILQLQSDQWIKMLSNDNNEGDVQHIIAKQIRNELQQIAECCEESVEDCLFLLHETIHRMKTGEYG